MVIAKFIRQILGFSAIIYPESRVLKEKTVPESILIWGGILEMVPDDVLSWQMTLGDMDYIYVDKFGTRFKPYSASKNVNCKQNYFYIDNLTKGLTPPQKTNYLQICTFNVHEFESLHLPDTLAHIPFKKFIAGNFIENTNVLVLQEVPGNKHGPYLDISGYYNKQLIFIKNGSKPDDGKQLYLCVIIDVSPNLNWLCYPVIVDEIQRGYIRVFSEYGTIAAYHYPTGPSIDMAFGKYGDFDNMKEAIKEKNNIQLNYTYEHVFGHGIPDYIVGDFNAMPTESCITFISSSYNGIKGLSTCYNNNEVDYIFYRGDKTMNTHTEILNWPYSDHLPVVLHVPDVPIEKIGGGDTMPAGTIKILIILIVLLIILLIYQYVRTSINNSTCDTNRNVGAASDIREGGK
jgi:hypothetical protein